MKKSTILLGLSIMLLLTGCDNPFSGKKPSARQMQEAIFSEEFPFVDFKKFAYDFVDNPEKAKENVYEVYIDTELSYNVPLYCRYALSDPYYYKENALHTLQYLAVKNSARMALGQNSMRPVLYEVHKKGELFKSRCLVRFIKTEKKWLCNSFETIYTNTKPKGSPAALFSTGVIYGSKEHLTELKSMGIELPAN